MDSIGTALIVFGSIFFIMAIIIYFVMKKKVYNPNCMEEVMAVYTTKANWTLFLIFSIILLLSGIIITFI